MTRRTRRPSPIPSILMTLALGVVIGTITALTSFAGPEGGEKVATEPTLESGLEPVGWLVGGTWRASLPGPGGAPRTVESTYAWGDHRRTIRMRISMTVDGKRRPHGDGLFWWDPAQGGIVWIDVDRDGNVTRGVITFDGDRITSEDTMTMKDGTVMSLRSTLERRGENSFYYRAFAPKDGEWSPIIEGEYRRGAEMTR